MKENKKLDDKIKSSFESLEKKAPDMLWSQLSDSLPTSSTDTLEPQPVDTHLYSKVRESFSSLHQKAPQHLWATINRQLNIDLVWVRLSKELDKAPSVNWQLTRWAAVLLLFMFSFTGGYYLYVQQHHSEYAVVPGNLLNLSFLTEKELATEVGQVEQTKLAEKIRKPAVSGARSSEKSSIAIEQQENLNSLFQSSPKDKQQEVASSGFSYNKSEARRSAQESEAGNEKASASAGFLSNRNSGFAGKPAASNSIEEELAKEAGYSPDFGQGLALEEGRTASSIPYKIANLPMPTPMVTESTFSIQGVELNPLALETVAEADKEKEIPLGNFSIGPVLAYNNSWLLNNETRNSFDKGSLISRSPTYKQNVGIALHYSFSLKSAFATEFHFISKAGQDYNTFSDGYYRKMGLELGYYKLYLQYEQIFFPHRESLFAGLIAKAGLYGGLLHKKKGEIRSTESTYSNFDYGLRVALGQEKRLDRLIIGYGFSGERGFTNIFMGSDKMPARFNKTYTLSFGPYLNFRFH